MKARADGFRELYLWLAALSYSIYLVHLPIIDYTQSLLLVLVYTAAVTLTLHYLVERPFLSVKNALRRQT